MIGTSRFDFGSGPGVDLPQQWDTKGNLFHLADVCARPSAAPVDFSNRSTSVLSDVHTNVVTWIISGVNLAILIHKDTTIQQCFSALVGKEALFGPLSLSFPKIINFTSSWNWTMLELQLTTLFPQAP